MGRRGGGVGGSDSRRGRQSFTRGQHGTSRRKKHYLRDRSTLMPKSKMLAGVAASLVIAGLIVDNSPVRAIGLHAPRAQSPHAAMAAPITNWHIIAGFSQLLPSDSGNTEAVDQFYPRT